MSTPAPAPAAKTTAGTMAVTPANRAPAKTEERGVTYFAFASKVEVRLTVNMVLEYLCVPTKSGVRASPADAVKFMKLCEARELNPWEGDAYLQGYDSKNGPMFNLITAHQAFLKRAEVNKVYQGKESGVIVMDMESKQIFELQGDFYHKKTQTLLGAWAKVYREDRKFPEYKRLNLEAFDKGWGRWESDPAGMIVKCFDEETEVLTTRGFEKFATAEGAILQVTDRGLEATDAVPFFQHYVGPMIHFRSRNGNFLVTPNHDLPLSVNGEREMPVEARHLMDMCQRDEIIMPLAPQFSSQPDYPIMDKWLILAAAYVADGSDNSRSSGFSIAVSRSPKVDLLRSLKLHSSEAEKKDAGAIAVASSGRAIRTLSDKTAFYYSRTAEISWLVERGKTINIESLLALSPRQARLFVDTWLQCDGDHAGSLLVGRIYSSRADHCAALEIAANRAGYSVSQRKVRHSDIGGPNYCLTLTSRTLTAIDKQYIRTIPNPGRGVWCVKVPTGKIIVRRHGFSAVCHQCAEADALRSAFPTTIGALYLVEELGLEEKNVTPPKIDAPPFISQPPPQLPAAPPAPEPPTQVAPISPNALPDEPPPAAPVNPDAGESHVGTGMAGARPLITDKCEGLNPGQVIDLIQQLQKRDNVSDDQVLGYCRSVKPKPLAGPSVTEVLHLADSKLRKLVNEWDTILPEIRNIQI